MKYKKNWHQRKRKTLIIDIVGVLWRKIQDYEEL